MQVHFLKIEDLKPAEYNPRKMTEKEAKDLMKSLKSFDFAEPIVVNDHPDRKNVIVGGHQRVEVALNKNDTDVLAFVKDYGAALIP